MSIKQNITLLHEELPENVTLVAISKTKPKEAIMEAYEVGQRIFGENRHKELIEKVDALPKDIEWHFIGSLQRTNVKYVVPRVELIHSVDSEKLMVEINKEASKYSKVMDILLEVHIAQEESKSGWNKLELVDFLATESYKELKNIRIRGVMCMASYTSDTKQIEREFAEIRECFDMAKENFFSHEESFDIISAGMSSDYKIAISQGANMVRIGSSIF